MMSRSILKRPRKSINYKSGVRSRVRRFLYKQWVRNDNTYMGLENDYLIGKKRYCAFDLCSMTVESYGALLRMQKRGELQTRFLTGSLYKYQIK